jgi:hypothetical protein
LRNPDSPAAKAFRKLGMILAGEQVKDEKKGFFQNLFKK